MRCKFNVHTCSATKNRRVDVNGAPPPPPPPPPNLAVTTKRKPHSLKRCLCSYRTSILLSSATVDPQPITKLLGEKKSLFMSCCVAETEGEWHESGDSVSASSTNARSERVVGKANPVEHSRIGKGSHERCPADKCSISFSQNCDVYASQDLRCKCCTDLPLNLGAPRNADCETSL